MPTQAKIRDHLLEVVLELDDEESKLLRNKGMKGMKIPRQLRLPTIDKWHAADDISDGTLQELLCFRKYMIHFKKKCTDTQIMKMTVESWALLDIDDLEMSHSLSQGGGDHYSRYYPCYAF